MKITLCSSAYFVEEVKSIKEQLERMGHKVLIFPDTVKLDGKIVHVTDFYRMRKADLDRSEYWNLKNRLMREHFRKIQESDAILVVNLDKKGITGYIGGNTLIEMGIAFFLGKKIFLWKEPSKDLPYYEEIVAMLPIIINEDLSKIK